MRREKRYNYIYKTINNLNGKYYIGMHSTDNLDDGYMGSGKRLWFSFNYHGRNNHSVEILEYYDTREELKERERVLVDEWVLKEVLCMNLVVGGGGFTNSEHQQKASKLGGASHAEKMKTDKIYRDKILRILNDNRIKAEKNGSFKGLQRFKGKTHTDEAKRKMSESAKERTGESNSQYGTCWVTRGGINKKIKKEDLEHHIEDGWLKGRKYSSPISFNGRIGQ